MKKILKWAGIVILSLFVLIQFYRPDRTNPPTDPSRALSSLVSVPPDISSMLKRSCNDCHSHETRWPWYSNVAPVSWLVASDVNEARKHLNLSDFAQYQSLRAVGKLDAMCENMEDGIMPLPKYLIMHPDAKLSQDDIRRFRTWVDSVADSLAGE